MFLVDCYIRLSSSFDNSFAVMPNTDTCASLATQSAVGLYAGLFLNISLHDNYSRHILSHSPLLFRIKITALLRKAQASCVCRRHRIQPQFWVEVSFWSFCSIFANVKCCKMFISALQKLIFLLCALQINISMHHYIWPYLNFWLIQTIV